MKERASSQGLKYQGVLGMLYEDIITEAEVRFFDLVGRELN